LKNLRIIAFTHKNLDLKEIGKLVLAPEEKQQILTSLKEELNIGELFYIGTCNRVELVFTLENDVNDYILNKIINHLTVNKFDNIDVIKNAASVYQDEAALIHLMRVSSSLESLVVGEKEILAQVRRSFDECHDWKLAGDFSRLCMNRVVKTAKEIYTDTKISEKPISVVSIA
jgi:glutamyl-tRNA reductase